MDGVTVTNTKSFTIRNTSAQLEKKKRTGTKSMLPWKTRWEERNLSETTPATVDEMGGQNT